MRIPLDLLVAYPVTIPVVCGNAGRAYQEALGIPGDPSSPRAHKLPERRLVPDPRVQVKYLHAPPDPLGRHELELLLAGLCHLGTLVPQPEAYPPAVAAELAVTRAAVLQHEG